MRTRSISWPRRGGDEVFIDYIVRTGRLTRHTDLPEGCMLSEQRLDEIAAGARNTAVLVNATQATPVPPHTMRSRWRGTWVSISPPPAFPSGASTRPCGRPATPCGPCGTTKSPPTNSKRRQHSPKTRFCARFELSIYVHVQSPHGTSVLPGLPDLIESGRRSREVARATNKGTES